MTKRDPQLMAAVLDAVRLCPASYNLPPYVQRALRFEHAGQNDLARACLARKEASDGLAAHQLISQGD